MSRNDIGDAYMMAINKPITKIIPYANNPRKNGAAVDKVAASIKEF
jgi:ParB-like chromosome segregation protein Spo0J